MAITEADIKVIIAAELKKQGFDKAQKATTNLEATFKKLGKTVASVFAVREIIRFGKASVMAFAEAEKEAAQLRNQLTSLNMAFATPVVNDYLDQLELLTGKTGGDLVTAFNQLSYATQDVTNAQNLLNLALDVSAATGKDLATVSAALQRAYKGEATAIAKLRIGLSTAELKGKKFAFVIEELERRFGGAATRNAGTFGTQVDRLRRAFEKAQESVGEGFVKGLDKSDIKIEELQQSMIKLGEVIGDTAASFTTFATDATKALDKFLQSNAYLKFRDFADFLFRQANFIVTGELLVPKTGSTGNQKRAAEKAAAAELRARNQILKQEKKNAELRKKIQTEEEKRARMALAQKRANTIFDMENIQIVAALQEKVDGETRLRLTALLALNTSNSIAAEKLADMVIRLQAPALANLDVFLKSGDTIDDLIVKLITSQAKLAGLQLLAEDFPIPEDIFQEWEDSMDEVLKKLKEMLELLDELDKKKKKTGFYALDSLGFSSLEAYQEYRRGERASIVGSSAVGSGMTAANTSFLPNVTNNGGATVVVNVAGNVTSERDLVTVITDQIYQQQKSGKQIVYSSTTI